MCPVFSFKTHLKNLMVEKKILFCNLLVIALVGNKLDLSEKRQVKSQVGQDFATENNLIFIETSAKTGEFIDELFYQVGKKIPKNITDDQQKNQNSNQKIRPSLPKSTGRKGCC
ncbi:rab2a member ras oncogene family [Anaeramoeba ignava]|uniref:Rab2a member ras oncogene family n=1 Tax=Anaeramoeba ignava TaxID=1746090 RepID=A0A9Q0R488_ANAIG|nr:rab2a member ras oncogene family [Anaeramoeba ignava]